MGPPPMRTAILLALLLVSCLQLQKQDPISASLLPNVDRPVLRMSVRFGSPSQQKVEQGNRWYLWNFRDPACTVSARVDDQENVIEAFWQGNRDACEQVMSTYPFS